MSCDMSAGSFAVYVEEWGCGLARLSIYTSVDLTFVALQFKVNIKALNPRHKYEFRLILETFRLYTKVTKPRKECTNGMYTRPLVVVGLS